MAFNMKNIIKYHATEFASQCFHCQNQLIVSWKCMKDGFH